MFRRTDRQLPLLGAEQGLPAGARRRLTGSWAEGFRAQVVPELLAAEEEFSGLYSEEGRPNWSVAHLLGILLLQHQSGLSDQEALDALSFDVRWQHALSLSPDEAYLSRRSLVEFRRRLVTHDAEGALIRGVFDRISAKGIKQLGVSTKEQRLDSTLVASNIRLRGRLSLARETLRHFIRGLSDADRERLPEAIRSFASKDEGWESDGGDAEQAKHRLHEMGGWINEVLALFADTPSVVESERYRLLRRMADEHAAALGLCVAKDEDRDSDDDNEGGAHSGGAGHDDDEGGTSSAGTGNDDDEGGANSGGTGQNPQGKSPAESAKRARSVRRNAKKREKKSSSRVRTPAARFWSPHDPDASFGCKGAGYHVHITETCRNERTELLTDYHVLTAAESDVGKATAVVSRLRQGGIAPEVFYVDAGYPTPSELLTMPASGVDFCAPVHRGRLPKDSFSRSEFVRDAETGHVLRCPEGHAPTRHAERESSDTMHPRRSLHVFFEREKCTICPQLKRCPVRQPNHSGAHEYRLDLAPELIARDARWTEQHTEPFRERYRIRNGVEATMSELKRGHGMRRLRVRRMPSVLLQVALKATACNIKRWLRALLAPAIGLASLYSLFGSQIEDNSPTFRLAA